MNGASAIVAHIAQELDKASSMVSTAYRLLESGTTVELSALEGKIRWACLSVGDLPPEHGRRLMPAMQRLMDDLDRLDRAVRARMAGSPPPSPPGAGPGLPA